MVVLVLFWLAGYFNTAYYPSYTDISSSLTIYNSSSSEFTLRTMSYVSIAIPFVIAYIVWVWYKLAKPQDDVAKKAE
jgi:cytochrome d ubiquinol oxidase subunit II